VSPSIQPQKNFTGFSRFVSFDLLFSIRWPVSFSASFPVRLFGLSFVRIKFASFVSGSFFGLIFCLQQLPRFVF